MRTRRASMLVVLLVCASPAQARKPASAGASAEGSAPLLLANERLAAAQAAAPTLGRPRLLLRASLPLATPVWCAQGLWSRPPVGLWGLRSVEKPGAPIYDPSSRAFYASAGGTLVEVRPDRTLPVRLNDGPQGRDIDVRGKVGVLVSREPDHTIVRQRFARGQVTERKVLLAGERFFGPRLSPDGSQVLVAESRAEGGHVWLVRRDETSVDLGAGYDPAWLPDGRRIVYAQITHDRFRVTSGELWLLDTASGLRQPLTRGTRPAETHPVVAPDGKWIAFVDARSGDLYLAALEVRP